MEEGSFRITELTASDNFSGSAETLRLELDDGSG